MNSLRFAAKSYKKSANGMVSTAAPNKQRVQSHTSITGAVGLIVVMLFGILTALPPQLRGNCETWWDARKPITLAVLFLAMAMVEFLIFKVHRHNFDFSKAHAITAESNIRIVDRLIGSMSAFAMALPVVLALKHWFPLGLPVYCFAAPLWLIGLIPYFWLVEKYAKPSSTPDGLLVLGHLIRRPRASMSADERTACKTLAWSIVLRAFFIPVMLFSCFNFWQHWEINIAAALRTNSISLFGAALFQLIIAADTSIAVLGYATSSRILNSQIRWVDEKLSGWFFALICYPPFGLVLDNAVWSKVFDVWPEKVYAAHPIVGSFAFVAFLFLTAIYCWANASFGLRFSNLCNRGLVDCGPYRFIRHPSYASKNIAWWIGSFYLVFTNPPMFANVAAVLILINWIYYMRAMTEEAHMMRDADYRDYCKRVPWRFIPGII